MASLIAQLADEALGLLDVHSGAGWETHEIREALVAIAAIERQGLTTLAGLSERLCTILRESGSQVAMGATLSVDYADRIEARLLRLAADLLDDETEGRASDRRGREIVQLLDEEALAVEGLAIVWPVESEVLVSDRLGPHVVWSRDRMADLRRSIRRWETLVGCCVADSREVLREVPSAVWAERPELVETLQLHLWIGGLEP